MRKYFQVFKTSLLNVYIYRGNVLSSLLMNLLGIGALYFIWQKITKDYGSVGDYSINSIMSYYLLSGLFIGFFNARITRRYEEMIRLGLLGNTLIKPVNEILFIFFDRLGQKIGVIIFTIFTFGLPALAISSIRNTIICTPQSMFWLILYAVSSNVFLYIFYWFFGCFAFWILDTGGIRNVLNNLTKILKGHWFPLDLGPVAFQKVMSFLPFQYAMYYPIKIITTNTETNENIKGIIILTSYSILLLLLSLYLWKRGLRRYESVGA